MATTVSGDLMCPKCRASDRIRMFRSYPEEFFSLPPVTRSTVVVPAGAVMLVYLLSSLRFLTGSLYGHLTGWPFALSPPTNLLPKPLLLATIATAILLVAVDKSTRVFLLHVGRAALLQSRLYRELNGVASPLALAAVPVGLAGFGFAVSLGLGSLDLWVGMSTTWLSPGPDWVRLTAQAFLTGEVAVLIGLPMMALVMTWTFRGFSEYGLPPSDAGSFSNFARNLAYPYGLSALFMGLALSSGFQALFVVATCWFLGATFMAVRHTLKQGIEMELPVALLAAAPVALAFLFLTLRVRMGVANSDWTSLRGRPSVQPDLELLWLLGAVALAAMLALTAFVAATRVRREDARTKRARRETGVIWRNLLYCERCNGVHLPHQRDFVPASDVGALLGGSEPRSG